MDDNTRAIVKHYAMLAEMLGTIRGIEMLSQTLDDPDPGATLDRIRYVLEYNEAMAGKASRSAENLHEDMETLAKIVRER